MFLLIGVSIPLFSLLLAPFSSFFDFDFDFDGDFSITSWLPLSPLTISVFLIGTGSSGILIHDLTKFHYIFSIPIGFLFFLIFKKYVLDKLKSVKTYSVNSIDFIGKQAKVVHKIDKNMIGVISIVNENGKITYLAKSDELIEQDSVVEILELTKSNNAEIFIVKKIYQN